MKKSIFYNSSGEKTIFYDFDFSSMRVDIRANGYIDKVVYDCINNSIYYNRFDGIRYKKQ